MPARVREEDLDSRHHESPHWATMSRTHLLHSCFSAAAAALLVACSSVSGDVTEAKGIVSEAEAQARAEQTLVTFNYFAVRPEVVRIPANGNVRWVNEAPETVGFVVFPLSVAAKFRCTDLKPYFNRVGDVYQSHQLLTVESEDVRLPCALAPGTYDYEIWLMGAGFGSEINATNTPEQKLRAQIVVEAH
jgi:hypothetical protein